MHVLSLPTWWIHVSSMVEWVAAIFLVWRFADITQQLQWRYFAWGMLPSLVSGCCAITWHLFDNNPSFNWLVVIQATFTVIGNSTLALATFFIWRKGQRLAP